MVEYHPDCSECCGRGRCHWCLNKAGPVRLFSFEKHHFFHACAKHAELVKHSNRFPDLPAVGFDGSFRPQELTIDEEAQRRAIRLMEINQPTPATLR